MSNYFEKLAQSIEYTEEYSPFICNFGMYYETGKRQLGKEKTIMGLKPYLQRDLTVSLESPFFGRNLQKEAEKEPEIRRITFGSATKRTEAILPVFGNEDSSRLPVTFTGERNTGENIIIALQCPFDASVEEWKPYLWAGRMVYVLRKIHGYTNPIKIIKHPGLQYNPDLYMDDPLNLDYLQEVVNLSQDVELTTSSLTSELTNALFTIVLSSGASIESTLAGVPVYAHSPDCFMYPSCFRDLSKPEWKPEKILKNLIELSWCQWEYDEIEQAVERLYHYWRLNVHR